jgi:DNA-binding CsgD family transcriptional regulator
MAEIRTVTTLKSKRDDIARSIAAYEKKLNQARATLAYINDAIRIFERGEEGAFVAPTLTSIECSSGARWRVSVGIALSMGHATDLASINQMAAEAIVVCYCSGKRGDSKMHPFLTSEQIAERNEKILARKQDGLSNEQIGKEFGISRETVRGALKAAERRQLRNRRLAPLKAAFADPRWKHAAASSR